MSVLKPTALDTLVETLRLSELPKSEQEEVLLEVQDLVVQGALVKMLERMDESLKDEFSALIDGDDEDAIEAFVEAHVPDADQIIEEAIADVTEEMLLASEDEF